MNGRTMKLTPIRKRTTAKDKVDKPMIMARVPSMDARSFHRFMVVNLKVCEQLEDAYKGLP